MRRWGEESRQSVGQSYYHDKIFDGATIYPRNLFFVRAARELGPATRPVLETDEEEARQAKAPWRSIRMRGAVEARFIFSTLLGGDILPFGHLPLRPVLLPLSIESGKALLVNYLRAVEQGYTGLAQWLREAGEHWQRHATRDERGGPRIPSILEQIDFRRKLTGQNMNSGYKVLYNKSGTHLAACVLGLSFLPSVELNNLSLAPSGYAAEHTTLYFETTDLEEAYYLAAVLNSRVLDDAIKPFQTRGLFGERDISKRPFRLPLPRYDASQSSHRRLTELAEECHDKVTQALPVHHGKIQGERPIENLPKRHAPGRTQDHRLACEKNHVNSRDAPSAARQVLS